MEQKQKAILVGVNLNNQSDFEHSMKELGNLAAACDVELVQLIREHIFKDYIRCEMMTPYDQGGL